MLFLIAMVLAFGFAFFCGKPLKKHPYIFYITAVVLSSASVALSEINTHDLPVFVNTYIFGLFTRGAFATALWCIVMWTGALPNGSVAIKKLMPIRGELSIFAAILTLGHNIGYGKIYFVRLFTDSGKMSSNQITASILTIIMLLIMIPLTVMSFPKIRHKMNPKLWKKIQRTAYIFYGLIYIHIMVLTFPMARAGREGYIFSIFMYSLVFIGYAVFRIRKSFLKKHMQKNEFSVNIVCTIIVPALTFCLIFFAKAEKTPQEFQKTYKTVTTSAVAITSQITYRTVSQTTSALTVTTAKAISETTSSISSVSTASEIQISTTEILTDTPPQPEEVPDEESITEDEPIQDEPIPEETAPPEEIQETAEHPPESQCIYQNGQFSGSAYGYDGDVYVTVTIENDVIVSITGYSEENDTWYYDSAAGQVIQSIIDSQNTSVDVYSGATYSSNAIMSAVQQALESAKK